MKGRKNRIGKLRLSKEVLKNLGNAVGGYDYGNTKEGVTCADNSCIEVCSADSCISICECEKLNWHGR